jgi:molecular chaperone GrpE
MTDHTNPPITDETEISTEKLQQDLQDMTEIAKRALADLQNYKRKADEERSMLMSLGEINVIKELLTVIDSFTRAFTHIPEDIAKHDWVNGVTQIEKQLISIAKNVGLEEIPGVGSPLDPNVHDVLAQIPGEKDTILEEVEKGYTFKGKVIRASKVVTGNGQ